MKRETQRTLWLFEQVSNGSLFTNPWKTHLPQQIKSHLDASQDKNWDLKIVKPENPAQYQSKNELLQFGVDSALLRGQIEKIAEQMDLGKVQDGDRLVFLNSWHPGILLCRQKARKKGLKISIDVLWQSGEPKLWGSDNETKYGAKKRADFKRVIFCAADRNYFATYAQWMDLSEELKHFVSDETVQIVGWPMEYLLKAFSSPAAIVPRDTILFPQNTEPYYQSRISDTLKPLLPTFRVVVADENAYSRQSYIDLLHRSAAVIATGRRECLGVGIYEGLLAGAVPIVPELKSYQEIYNAHCMPVAWTSALDVAQRHKNDFADYVKAKIKLETTETLRKVAVSVSKEYFNGSRLYENLLR